MEAKEIAKKCFQVTITTRKSVHDLVNFGAFFTLMVALSRREHVDFDENLVEKYVNIIVNVDAPYYLRYSFSKFMFRNAKSFKKMQGKLQQTKRYKNLELQYGDTHHQRLHNLLNKLSFKNPIIDVGCNQGNNAIPLAKRLKSFPYYAIDVDPIALAKLSHKCEEENIDNITTFTSIGNLTESGIIDNQISYDVLLTEVVEHMAVEEAQQLVNQILAQININSLIISTPNKNFNIYYGFDEERLRHPDHKWEMTREDFEQWIERIVAPNYKKEFFGSGCVVDGQPVTSVVLISL